MGGLNDIRCWTRPYRVLSNGHRQHCGANSGWLDKLCRLIDHPRGSGKTRDIVMIVRLRTRALRFALALSTMLHQGRTSHAVQDQDHLWVSSHAHPDWDRLAVADACSSQDAFWPDATELLLCPMELALAQKDASEAFSNQRSARSRIGNSSQKHAANATAAASQAGTVLMHQHPVQRCLYLEVPR